MFIRLEVQSQDNSRPLSLQLMAAPTVHVCFELFKFLPVEIDGVRGGVSVVDVVCWRKNQLKDFEIRRFQFPQGVPVAPFIPEK